jgi:hypothetical protein
MKKEKTLYGLEQKSWNEVINLNEREWQSSYSVHFPLHPSGTENFIYMDCALNAYTLPVVPGLKTRTEGLLDVLNSIESMIVQFAFDEVPFVPDFRLSKIELEEGRFPIVKASYLAWDLLYEIEYFASRLDEKHNALWIKATVHNESETTRKACIRTKVNFQKERKIFDYHYVPFYWDSSKWLKDNTVSCQENEIFRDKKLIGFVKENDFEFNWEKKASFKDEDYNSLFHCSTPYYVTPLMRLKEVENVMRFSGELARGESRSFTLALLTDDKSTDIHAQKLKESSRQAARKTVLQEFRETTDSAGNVSMNLPFNSADGAFSEMQICNYQMLIDFDYLPGLQPCQGGSGERFYVWTWEAMCMLRPMLQLGHFDKAKKAIDFIFSLQDNGCPPEGEFTSTEGAIGTTGPRWANATASALALAADYYNYSHDKEFLKEYLPKMLRGGDWILGEIRATRTPDANGSRSAVHGLMPFACATDGDVGHIVAFTDAFTYYGLDKVVKMLKSINHERYHEFASELKQYKKDINAAIDLMIQEDGYIDRKIVLDSDKAVIRKKFQNICGSQTLVFTGALDPDDKRFAKHIKYCENNTNSGFFVGNMDRDIVYVGVGEHVWQNVYLRRGEWKKAYSILQANLKYGMTSDTFLVQERFAKNDPAYTPWQPNSSGNGRMLEMICNQFYFEYEDSDFGFVTTFFAAMPPSWFEISPEISLKGFYTTEGRISIEAANKTFKISCSGFNLKDRIIRFPEYLNVKIDPASAENLGKGFLKVLTDNTDLKGKFSI